MTVRKFLDLSTGHLTEETRDRLSDGEGPTPTYPHPDGFGWLVWVPEDQGVMAELEKWAEDVNCPADLLACFKAARKRGCDYILFDSDGEPVDYLTDYEAEPEPTDPRQRQAMGYPEAPEDTPSLDDHPMAIFHQNERE